MTVRGAGPGPISWEEHMLSGALIVESLQVGVVLDDPGLVIQRLSRASPAHVTPDQSAVWSLLEFDSDSADPDLLAEELHTGSTLPGDTPISTPMARYTSSFLTG
jgi:hypothetical protein